MLLLQIFCRDRYKVDPLRKMEWILWIVGWMIYSTILKIYCEVTIQGNKQSS